MGPLSARCSISRRSAWWLQGVWKLLANPMFTSPCISIGKWKRLLKAPMAVRNQTVAMSCRTYVAPLTSVWWLRLPIKSVLLCLFECHWYQIHQCMLAHFHPPVLLAIVSWLSSRSRCRPASSWCWVSSLYHSNFVIHHLELTVGRRMLSPPRLFQLVTEGPTPTLP